MPLVTIMVEDEWNSIADATCTFKAAPNFARSSWDWIGLYKVLTPPLNLLVLISMFNEV
jgi:inositol-1,4,5-trisphosphate 5-phosphatase